MDSARTPTRPRGEVVLRDAKYTVERFERDLPHGHETRHVVVHPGAVVILPVTHDGRVLLVDNVRFALGRTLRELPAGTLEEGETPSGCAARELEEETGHRAGAIRRLTSFYSSPGFCTEELHAYLATDLERTEQHLDPGESMTVVARTMDEALDDVRTGRIRDAKTIATLLFYRAFPASER